MGFLYFLGYVSAKTYTCLALAITMFCGFVEYGCKWIVNRNGLRRKDREGKRKELEKYCDRYASLLGFKCNINFKEP